MLLHRQYINRFFRLQSHLARFLRRDLMMQRIIRGIPELQLKRSSPRLLVSGSSTDSGGPIKNKKGKKKPRDGSKRKKTKQSKGKTGGAKKGNKKVKSKTLY